jgi:hypothetical protein
LSQINIWTTTTWSNVWVVLPIHLNWVLDMSTRFKVFASHNILQYLCDFIHVFIFVTVSKCRKSPKLTNIVILAQKQYYLLLLPTPTYIHSVIWDPNLLQSDIINRESSLESSRTQQRSKYLAFLATKLNIGTHFATKHCTICIYPEPVYRRLLAA